MGIQSHFNACLFAQYQSIDCINNFLYKMMEASTRQPLSGIQNTVCTLERDHTPSGKITKNQGNYSRKIRTEQIQQQHSVEASTKHKTLRETGSIVKQKVLATPITPFELEQLNSQNQVDDTPKGLIVRKSKDKEQLSSCLRKQIMLEEELRTLKHQLQPKDKQKIMKILSDEFGIERDIVTLTSDEFDPFFSHKSNMRLSLLARMIADTHQQCEKHWKNNIYQSFQEAPVLELFEGTDPDEPISLTQVTKQLGLLLHSQKCHTKKDLCAIYRRISPFTRLNLTEELCQPSRSQLRSQLG